jgi:hypothetical protein
MLALETNPHDNFRKLEEVGDKWTTGVLEAEGVSPVDRLRILRWGVSHEGEGRAAYLRTSYQRLPQQRSVAPQTTSQVNGFYAPVGLPMGLYPARQQTPAVKHFFANTSLSGLRRPDTGKLGDASVSRATAH